MVLSLIHISGISAAVYCGDKRLGVFGKLSNEINGELEIAKDQKDSQNIYLGELDYEALMSCVDGELRYQPLSPYAAVKRDLALVSSISPQVVFSSQTNARSRLTAA